MTAPKTPNRLRATVLLAASAALLAACAQPADDNAPPASSGAPAPATASAPPPPPASGRTSGNGIVTYPDYAAVVAQPGDTVAAMAARAGLTSSELAAYNGLPISYVPSAGDELVLPPRAGGYDALAAAAPAPAAPAPDPSVLSGAPAAPAPQTAGAVDPVTGWSPAAIGAAIDDAPASGTAAAAPPSTGRVLDGAGVSREVIYHDVQDGETVYSIARNYGLPADTLIAWNALSGPSYAVRPGQVLTVPAGGPPPVQDSAALIPATPGEGGVAAPPPSAGAPLPPDTIPPQPLASPQLGQFQTETPAAAAPAAPPAPAIEPAAPAAAPAVAALTAPGDGKLQPPVPGRIIKPYSREPGANRNDGVDFAATPGEEVRAAAAGEVALVSTSLGEWGTIVLVRHADGLMTVYGRLASSAVAKGQQVGAGDVLGVVAEPTGGQAMMHFEVRRGAFSENPEDFL